MSAIIHVMELLGGTTIALLIILSIGLLGPEIFRRLKFPYFSSLILLGALLGANGVGVVESNETIEFFGFLGFTFLMFMAGLESNVKNLQQTSGRVAVLSILNVLIPLAAGIGLTRVFGYGWDAAIMTGIILSSSSVAIIFPSIRSAKFLKQEEGQMMINAVLMEDIFSLIALAVFLQIVSPVGDLELPMYFGIVFSAFVLLGFVLPKVARIILANPIFHRQDEHEEQLRFLIIILIAVLVLFSALNVHPILAAFFVGLLLSKVVTAPEIREKIHTLGYGLFVPVFFFIIGTEMDLSLFLQADVRNIFIIALIFTAILSKFISGYIAGRFVKLSNDHATVFGIVSTTQLTTTLAATFAGSTLGVLDTPLVTAIIILSIITTIFAPIVAQIFSDSHKMTTV